MSFALTKNEPKFYVNLAIMILIMVGFRFITPPAGMTADGLAVVGVLFWSPLRMALHRHDLAFLHGSCRARHDRCRNPWMPCSEARSATTPICFCLFFLHGGEHHQRGRHCPNMWPGASSAFPWWSEGRGCSCSCSAIAMCALATMLTMTAAVLVAFPLIKEVCRQYGYKPGDSFPMILPARHAVRPPTSRT